MRHFCRVLTYKRQLMKTIKKTLYISLLCLAVVFTGCNSSDDDNNDGNNGDNGGDNGGGTEFYTATVAGASFEASTDPASLIGATVTTGNGITIATAQGSTNNGTFINFSIINYNGPDTYTTGDAIDNSNMIMYGTVNPVAAWSSNGVTFLVGGLQPGEITITSDADGVLEGTFSFEGYNGDDQTSKMVTSGSFKVNID